METAFPGVLRSLACGGDTSEDGPGDPSCPQWIRSSGLLSLCLLGSHQHVLGGVDNDDTEHL